jgi:DNA-binding transcriptional regulator YbjK
MRSARRTLVADAVIATLAREGSRGLTHRAVDETAGLPPGSTSYYLRTRAGLLEAAVERLAELDAAAIPPLEGRPLAGQLARVVTQQLTTHRTRLIARYELSLEAVRRPALAEVLSSGRRRVRDAVAARLVEDGVDDAVARSDDVLAMLEGLLFAGLTSFAQDRARPRRDIQRAIERVLERA